MLLQSVTQSLTAFWQALGAPLATQKITWRSRLSLRHGLVQVCAGSFMWVLMVSGPASALGAAPEIEWTSGLISVKARGLALNDVLREVSLRTGAVIKGAESLTQTVTADLDRMALVDGLRALLSRQNYLIVEGGRSRSAATRVFVVGPATGVTSLAAMSPGSPFAAEARSSRLTDADPAQRIEAVERLGERHDEQSLALLRQASNDPSAAVRAVAIEALQARGAGVVAGLLGRTP